MAAAATPSTTYCSRADIESKLSAYGVVGALDDNADGSEDTSGSASTAWINQAINHGTNRVNMFLLSRYDASELALSAIACEWALVHACRWLCTRRGNPCPSSLAYDCEQADAAMKEIAAGKGQLGDAAPRANGLPSHMNTRIDRNYRYGKTRVIRPESDQTTPDYPQRLDQGAEYYPYR